VIGFQQEKIYDSRTYSLATHPGEMLLAEFLIPLQLSQRALAKTLQVPYPQMNALINGPTRMTPQLALRLAKFLGMSADFWLNLQMRWDLYYTQQTEAKTLESIPSYASNIQI
jgi:addiction module HigA family antidote